MKDLKVKNYLFQAIDRAILETILQKGTTKNICESMKKKYQGIHGDKLDDVAITETILRSIAPKFDYVMCSIEESNNIDEMSIDELQSSLLVHEQRIN
ncbi:unnamed protein product [Prunus brigantina]